MNILTTAWLMQLMDIKASDLINGEQQAYYTEILANYGSNSGTFVIEHGLHYVREAT